MSESNALVVKQEENFLAPVTDLDTILNAYQVKKLFIEKALRQDLDYGTIPGSAKPALFKPGAEKLANIYGFAPVFEDVQTIEDWTGENHDGEPFFYYRQKCKLYKADRLIGTADGSCNSWEKKYRYREAQRLCPECGQPTIFKSKPPKRGFYCWSKKGGCGAQFPDNDKRITEQELGQVKNPDICDAANTILKMAQKRALVAAILIATGASDYFTQDIDDFVTITPDVIDGSFTETTPPPWDDTPPAEPPAAKIDLATAENIIGSDQVRYGDKDSETLSHMSRSIAKRLRDNHLTPEQRDELQLKQDAIAVILQSRENKELP